MRWLGHVVPGEDDAPVKSCFDKRTQLLKFCALGSDHTTVVVSKKKKKQFVQLLECLLLFHSKNVCKIKTT